MLTLVGLMVLAAGVVIEALGDAQRQRAQERTPREFSSECLYGESVPIPEL